MHNLLSFSFVSILISMIIILVISSIDLSNFSAITTYALSCPTALTQTTEPTFPSNLPYSACCSILSE